MKISECQEIEAKCPDVASSTEDYATRFSGRIGAWFLAIQDAATLRFLKPYEAQHITVADVGGGHAQNVGAVLNAGHHIYVTGSDATCSLRLAPFQASDLGANLTFQVCPLTEIPVSERHFQVVLSYRMLSHLGHWPEFIAELCRISSDRVIVDYPTYRSVNFLNSLLFFFKKGVERNTRSFLIFHEKEIVEVFNSHGFELEGRVGQYVFPMALHRMHKWVPLAKLLEGCCRLLGLSWLFGSPVIACFRRRRERDPS